MQQHTNHTTSAPGSQETWASAKPPAVDVVRRGLDPTTFAADGRPVEASGKRVIERLLRLDGSVAQEIIVETITLTVMRTEPQRTMVQGRTEPVANPWTEGEAGLPTAPVATESDGPAFRFPAWLLVLAAAVGAGVTSRTDRHLVAGGVAAAVLLAGGRWLGSPGCRLLPQTAGRGVFRDPTSDPSPHVGR